MGKTVLAIDDSVEMRTLIKIALEEEGFEVVLANDGGEALLFLTRGLNPDVILLDSLMPVMDGQTFLNVLTSKKSAGCFYEIPVVAISGTGEELANVSGYLFKPFDVDELIAAVKFHSAQQKGTPDSDVPLKHGLSRHSQ